MTDIKTRRCIKVMANPKGGNVVASGMVSTFITKITTAATIYVLQCSSRAVLVHLLLYFFLLDTGSLSVVPSSDSHHWLFGCGSVCASSSESLCRSLRLRGSFLASSPSPLLSIAPLSFHGTAVYNNVFFFGQVCKKTTVSAYDVRIRNMLATGPALREKRKGGGCDKFGLCETL